MREGNLPIRLPIGGGKKDTISFARITEVPASGRRAYKGRLLSLFTTGTPLVLSATVGTSDIVIFNLLEASAGTTFLGVGDQIALLKSIGKVKIDTVSYKAYVCEEWPRGYP